MPSGEENMNDTQQKKPDPHSTAPQEDEEIIDLLDEVPEGSTQHPVSALERKLLDLEHRTPAQDRSTLDLQDINDLIRLDFDQANNEKGQTEVLFPDDPDPVAARVFEEGAGRPATQENEMERISEFDKQALETEDLLDVERILGGPALEEKEPEPEEDELLELIDADEEDSDDEIVWFDDLDKQIALPETGAEASPPKTEILDAATRPGQETSAADLFSANARATLADAPTAAGIGASAAAAATAAAIHPPFPSAVGVSPPAEPGAPPTAPPALSDAEIEAVVERVIERKLGRTIESVIHQAIENAVSKEIERLKRLLLENDQGAAP
jgi:hypothetical protein